MNKHSRNCQYLLQTSAFACLDYVICAPGEPTVSGTSTARSRTAAVSRLPGQTESQRRPPSHMAPAGVPGRSSAGPPA
jgi:hypothetical protein